MLIGAQDHQCLRVSKMYHTLSHRAIFVWYITKFFGNHVGAPTILFEYYVYVISFNLCM